MISKSASSNLITIFSFIDAKNKKRNRKENKWNVNNVDYQNKRYQVYDSIWYRLHVNIK